MVYMWQPYLKKTMSTCASVICFSCMVLLMPGILTYDWYWGIGVSYPDKYDMNPDKCDMNPDKCDMNPEISDMYTVTLTICIRTQAPGS